MTPRSEIKLDSPRRIASALHQLRRSQPDESEMLFSLIRWVTSTIDLDELLDRIIQLSAQLTRCEGALIYLWDEDARRLVVRAAVPGYRRWVGRYSLRMGEGLTGWTAATSEPGIIRERPRDDPRFLSVPEMNDEQFRSYLTIPLVTPTQRLLGVITMHTKEPHEFSSDDLVLMQVVASLVSAALENAQLFHQRTRQLELIEALAGIAKAVTRSGAVTQALHTAATVATAALRANVGVLLAATGERTSLQVRAATTNVIGPAVPLSASLARLLESADTQTLTLRQREDLARGLILGVPVPAGIAAPLRIDERCLGLLVCLAEPQRVFSREDGELLTIAAAPTALILENARLTDELPARDPEGDFFRALTVGDEPAGVIETRALRLGLDPSCPHIVASFAIRTDTRDGNSLTAWRQVRHYLDTFFPRVAMLSDATTASIIVETSDEEHLSERLEIAIESAEAHGSVHIICGISQTCRAVADWQVGIEQALQAVQGWTSRPDVRKVIRFDQLGSARYLKTLIQVPPSSLELQIQRIHEYDIDHNTNLLATLDRFLESHGTFKSTADRLFVHRNTLRQRLKRIEEISSIDLFDRTDRFEIQFALRLFRIRQLEAVSAADQTQRHARGLSAP